MKKVISVILSFVFLLTGCGEPQGSDGQVALRVAIVQQLDHASLDEIRAAIQAELEVIGAEYDIRIQCDVYNGQNDASLLNQIGAKVLSGGYTLVIPIATLAAQCMATAVDGKIPVVCAAVSDPEGAGLAELPGVTGTCDALDTAFLLDMMLAADPDVTTVGLLYSNSEANSQVPIAEAKAYLEEKGIEWVEKTGNTSGEILEAAGALVGRVDAVFTPTDNVVMAAETGVAEILTAAGIPHYAGADSFVASGAFAACGVNYTELGRRTARLAMDCVFTNSVPAWVTLPGGAVTVNMDTAASLDLDCSPFYDLADTVTEVES